ncbi:hypothetical protein [Shewanella algae]|uniref:hypothetical protein n=1 Tax=Shewanella algae TaxID=38313 RepID=UPI00313D5490
MFAGLKHWHRKQRALDALAGSLLSLERYLVDKDGLLGVTEDDWIMMSQFGYRYLQETQESVWKTDNEKSCRESCQKKKDIDRESRIASKET